MDPQMAAHTHSTLDGDDPEEGPEDEEQEATNAKEIPRSASKEKSIYKGLQTWMSKEEGLKKKRRKFLPRLTHSKEDSAKKYLEDLALGMGQQELDMLSEELETNEEVNEWLYVDLFFGFLVLLNAFIIGLEIIYNKDDPQTINIWFIIDLAFFCAFSGEFIIRVFGAKTWRKVYTDIWMYIDIFLLSVTAVDLFVIRWIIDDGGGDEENPGQSLTVFRAFRVFRLARLVRVSKLFKSVNQLVVGLYISFRTLLWAILLIFLAIFIVAVFMVEMVGKEGKYDMSVRLNWEVLSKAIESLILVATVSDWQGVIGPIKMEQPLFLLPLAGFLVLMIMGIFNMVIGVMVYTALSLEESASQKSAMQTAFDHRIGLLRLKKIMSSINSRPTLRSPHRMGVHEFFQLYDDDVFRQALAFLDDKLTFKQLREIIYVLAVPTTTSATQTSVGHEETLEFSIDVFCHALSWLANGVLTPLDITYLRTASQCALAVVNTCHDEHVRGIAALLENLDHLYKVAQEVFPVLSEIKMTKPSDRTIVAGNLQALYLSNFRKREKEMTHGRVDARNSFSQEFLGPQAAEKRILASKYDDSIPLQVPHMKTFTPILSESQYEEMRMTDRIRKNPGLANGNLRVEMTGLALWAEHPWNAVDTSLSDDTYAHVVKYSNLAKKQAQQLVERVEAEQKANSRRSLLKGKSSFMFGQDSYAQSFKNKLCGCFGGLGGTASGSSGPNAERDTDEEEDDEDGAGGKGDEMSSTSFRIIFGVPGKSNSNNSAAKSGAAKMMRGASSMGSFLGGGGSQAMAGRRHSLGIRAGRVKRAQRQLDRSKQVEKNLFTMSPRSHRSHDASGRSPRGKLGEIPNLMGDGNRTVTKPGEDGGTVYLKFDEEAPLRRGSSVEIGADALAGKSLGSPDDSDEKKILHSLKTQGLANSESQNQELLEQFVFWRERINNAWFRIDMFYLFLSIIAGILFGISLSTRTGYNINVAEIANRSDTDVWKTIEILFCCIFFFENATRYLLYMQFEKHNDLEVVCGVLPKWTYVCVSTMLFPCEFYRFLFDDPFTVGDTVLLVCGVSMNITVVPFRIVFTQLLRMGRLEIRIEEVWLLIQSTRSAVKTLFWIGVGMGLLLYVMAIFAIIFVRDQKLTGGEVYFGDITKSCVSLLQIVTFDGWSAVVRPIVDQRPFLMVYFILVVIVFNFGMLNIIIGIFCESVNDILEERSKRVQIQRQTKMRKEMKQLQTNLSEYVTMDTDGHAWMDKRLLDKMFAQKSEVGDSAASLRFGGLTDKQWQMILDAIDVDTSVNLISMTDFFSAVEAWRKDKVQALDLYAIRVTCTKLHQRVKGMVSLIVRIQREVLKKLPKINNDLHALKSKLYPPKGNIRMGFKAAIKRTLMMNRLATTVPSELADGVEASGKRASADGDPGAPRESADTQRKFGYLYRSRETSRMLGCQDVHSLNPFDCFRFHDWLKRSEAALSTTAMKHELAELIAKNSQLKRDRKRQENIILLKERRIKTAARENFKKMMRSGNGFSSEEGEASAILGTSLGRNSFVNQGKSLELGGRQCIQMGILYKKSPGKTLDSME